MLEDRLDEEQLIAEERCTEDTTHQLLAGKISWLESLQDVISIPPSATVEDAVTEMISKRVGCVLVTDDDDGMVGLFSERDVLTRVVATGRNPKEVAVRDVMTADPECLTMDSKIVFALNKMTVGGFRHIPIVDQTGHPKAVVSMRDIVEHVVSFYANVIFNLPDSDASAPTAREGA